jgi:hypothetical protein
MLSDSPSIVDALIRPSKKELSGEIAQHVSFDKKRLDFGPPKMAPARIQLGTSEVPGAHE